MSWTMVWTLSSLFPTSKTGSSNLVAWDMSNSTPSATGLFEIGSSFSPLVLQPRRLFKSFLAESMASLATGSGRMKVKSSK